jgi:hypothetical protein
LGGDVRRDIIGERRQAREGDAIIDNTIGRVLVRTDIDADDAATPLAAHQTLRRRFHAAVVEAHAVDDGAIFGKPEQARARIAGLRPRCDGAAFDEAEAESQHRVRHLGILVEAGREPDGVGKIEPEGAHRKARIGHLGARNKRLAERQKFQRGAVRRLRRKQPKGGRACVKYRCNRHVRLIIPTPDFVLGPFQQETDRFLKAEYKC